MVLFIFTVTSVNNRQTDGCVYAGVVGNLPELGNWNSSNAVRATGPHDGQYTAKVKLPDGLERFEFKWIFCHRDRVIWEAGPNRIVTNLPNTRGFICHITNPFSGPAKMEIVPLSMDQRNKYRNRGGLTSSLNPLKWRTLNQILGLGLGFLVVIGSYTAATR